MSAKLILQMTPEQAERLRLLDDETKASLGITGITFSETMPEGLKDREVITFRDIEAPLQNAEDYEDYYKKLTSSYIELVSDEKELTTASLNRDSIARKYPRGTVRQVIVDEIRIKDLYYRNFDKESVAYVEIEKGVLARIFFHHVWHSIYHQFDWNEVFGSVINCIVIGASADGLIHLLYCRNESDKRWVELSLGQTLKAVVTYISEDFESFEFDLEGICGAFLTSEDLQKQGIENPKDIRLGQTFTVYIDYLDSRNGALGISLTPPSNDDYEDDKSEV
jgi:hypothetical protein